jgi:hypothetical protein
LVKLQVSLRPNPQGKRKEKHAQEKSHGMMLNSITLIESTFVPADKVVPAGIHNGEFPIPAVMAAIPVVPFPPTFPLDSEER